MELQYLFFVILSLQGLATSAPVDTPLSSRNTRAVKRTTAFDGTQIDWVPINSQTPNGNIADAPPLSQAHKLLASSNDPLKPKALLQMPGAELGPEGTVPVFVANNATQQMQHSKSAPPGQLGRKRQDAGVHWYASSAEYVSNHGGSAVYSLYDTYTESNNDFSLLQTAVTRDNVPNPLDNSQLIGQTVEAGWINYPAQISLPHLFTFYTTNGYQTLADNQGGWNRDVAGWVQVDTEIFPGTAFSPLSTRGGTQYELQIQYWLYQGNWWLFVLDRWIGYYPATLFGANTDASRSLQTQSATILFYGEIYNSESGLTTTDMGSGNFGETGYGQSAYIREIVYTDLNDAQQYYDGSAGAVVSDTSRYDMVTHFDNRDDWGSYMFLGGPGAGGVVGG